MRSLLGAMPDQECEHQRWLVAALTLPILAHGAVVGGVVLFLLCLVDLDRLTRRSRHKTSLILTRTLPSALPAPQDPVATRRMAPQSAAPFVGDLSFVQSK
jgi:hypothetical protein